jgi:hypothetical protein
MENAHTDLNPASGFDSVETYKNRYGQVLSESTVLSESQKGGDKRVGKQYRTNRL